MGQAILVTSGKGGAGKTTFVANVGAALTRRGKKVLLIDANFGLRNLDLVLGLSSQVVYDLTDLIGGACPLDKGILDHPKCPGLSMIAAPFSLEKKVPVEGLKTLVQTLKREVDFILIDSAAGVGASFLTAVYACDRAIIITNPNPCSVRDSEQTALLLEKFGVKNLKLVINRADPSVMKKKSAYTVDDIIDTVRVGLLGIIPQDKRLSEDMDQGLLPFEDYYVKANIAFFNISRRMCGETVPVMKI